MATELKELVERVAAETDVKKSATILASGLADFLDELTHDPVAIAAKAAELRAQADAIGNAVLDNTEVKTAHAPVHAPVNAPTSKVQPHAEPHAHPRKGK